MSTPPRISCVFARILWLGSIVFVVAVFATGFDAGHGTAAAQMADPLDTGNAPLIPKWQWRQVLMPLRVRGRFNTVTVHPENPDIIWVGTEEGTVIRTEDGGSVWQEVEPSPTSVQRRSVWGWVPELPKLGAVEPPLYSVFIDPPYTTVVERVGIPFETLFKPAPGGFNSFLRGGSSKTRYLRGYYIKNIFKRKETNFIKGGFFPKDAKISQNILKQASTSRVSWVNPIWSIAYCKGSPFPLMVASQDELYGSNDEGLTYVRLFKLPGKITNRFVKCDRTTQPISPWRPRSASTCPTTEASASTQT